MNSFIQKIVCHNILMLKILLLGIKTIETYFFSWKKKPQTKDLLSDKPNKID